MPPRRPSLSALIEALAHPDAQPRESAVARLRIAGRPAVPKLVALAGDSDAPAEARAAALRALAGIDAAAAVPAASAALDSPADALALESLETLRAALQERPDTAAATTALDALTQLALSAAVPPARRVAALDALADIGDALLAPILDTLTHDNDPRVAARARSARRHAGAGTTSLADLLAAGTLPATPSVLLDAMDAARAETSVTDLQRLVERVRERERGSTPGERAEWSPVRARAHRLLAERRSTLALYDLREMLQTAEIPDSPDLVAAAAAIADAEALPAVAVRWLGAAAAPHGLRDALAQAARAIIEREGLTRAHPLLTQLLTRYPDAAPLVALAPRSQKRKPMRT